MFDSKLPLIGLHGCDPLFLLPISILQREKLSAKGQHRDGSVSENLSH